MTSAGVGPARMAGNERLSVDAVHDERTIGYSPECRYSADIASSRVRVLVVSDVRLVRDALSTCLAACDRIELLGGVSSAADALERLDGGTPAMVLVDLSRPEGLGIVRALSAVPGASIVAFAVSGEHDILACAEAGAAGYVPHDATVELLIGVVQSIARGELPCSPRMAASLFRHLGTLASHGSPSTGTVLTSRERQIALLIERGLSNKEIGRSLNIEVATVKNHVHNILEKLGVGTRAAAATRLRASSMVLER